MCKHRTALRLRVPLLSPVLQSKSKLQPNKSQAKWPSGFEGSWFDRHLRQGSGQHPLAGSPQHQRAFLFALGRPGDGPAVACPGALAVLSGSGQSPGGGLRHNCRKWTVGPLWSV